MSLDALGCTHATMGTTTGRNAARRSKSFKSILNSDWSLQLDSMKSESLVIPDQHAGVNTFSGLVLNINVPSSDGKAKSLKSTPPVRTGA